MPESSSTTPNFPTTQGIKYAGSKLKLIPHILELSSKTRARSVFDGFSGTSRVSQAFAQSGYQVHSNDLSEWSKCFGTCYLLNKKTKQDYTELIEHLNNLKPEDGWFSKHYGGTVQKDNTENAIQPDGLKKPWQLKNTRKLDAIRNEIDCLQLDPVTKAVALTSLMLALDKVDNTLGHYVSYLKNWSTRSYNDLILKIPELWENEQDHKVTQGSVFTHLHSQHSDLSYYDPPYGSNNEKMPPSRVRYASYYHIWKSICLNDTPLIFGKSGRRNDSSDKYPSSPFEEFRKNKSGEFIAIEHIDKLIKQTTSPWIILSYSSGGRATASDLSDILNSQGSIERLVEIDYKRNVMGEMRWSNQWVNEASLVNREYLFLLKKR